MVTVGSSAQRSSGPSARSRSVGEDLRSKAGLSTSAFQVLPVGAAPSPLPIPLPTPGLGAGAPEVLPNIPLPVPVETVEEVTKLVGSLSGPMLTEVLGNLQKLLAPPVG